MQSQTDGSSLRAASTLGSYTTGKWKFVPAGACRQLREGRLQVALVLRVGKETQVLSTAEHTWFSKAAGRMAKSGMGGPLLTVVHTTAQRQLPLTSHQHISHLNLPA